MNQYIIVFCVFVPLVVVWIVICSLMLYATNKSRFSGGLTAADARELSAKAQLDYRNKQAKLKASTRTESQILRCIAKIARHGKLRSAVFFKDDSARKYDWIEANVKYLRSFGYEVQLMPRFCNSSDIIISAAYHVSW